MFGRATIKLGIGPHSSSLSFNTLPLDPGICTHETMIEQVIIIYVKMLHMFHFFCDTVYNEFVDLCFCSYLCLFVCLAS